MLAISTEFFELKLMFIYDSSVCRQCINAMIMNGELYTLLDVGFNWDFTVYNISTAMRTGPSAVGRVVVDVEDMSLPIFREQCSMKRVSRTFSLTPK